MTKLEYVRECRAYYDRLRLEHEQAFEVATRELRAACLEAAMLVDSRNGGRAATYSLEEVAKAATLTRERIRQWVALAEREAKAR